MTKRREVSRVLDTRPRMFSLPVAIILPALFVTGISTMLPLMLGMPIYMLILTAFTFNTAYFFLCGQEWWRLIVKFQTPPRWVRADVQAIPFTLNRKKHENSRKRS